jgi:bifunctional UDP-N-acetylglucosamine pyrophosphorylase / glucosamine-1-phosphate N-acetyltransferase
VITADVPADALAITRSDLRVKEGWAARYRQMKQARKAAAKKV